MPGTRRIILGSLLLLLAVSGCDCEARVRKLISSSSKDEERVAARTEIVVQDQVREIEPNDDPDNATPIVLRKELRTVYGELSSGQDVDWFSVAMEEGEGELFELIVTPTSSALDIALYLEVPGAPDSAPLLYDVGKSGQAESVPILSVGSVSGDVSSGKGPQRFFVAAAGKTKEIDASNGGYKIEFRRRLAGGVVESEPNDLVHLATRLKAPGEIQGFYDRPRDQDIYFVAAEDLSAPSYRLELSNIAGLTQQLRVYADSRLGEPLLGLTVSGNQVAEIPSFAMPKDAGGLWFVLSAGDSFDRERSYRLRISEHAPVTGFALETEPNDSAERAQMIDTSLPVRGYLHDAADIDRFRMVVEPKSVLNQGNEGGAHADLDPGVQEMQEVKLDPFANVPEKQAPERVFHFRLNPLGSKHLLGLRWISADGEQALSAASADESVTFCNLVVTPGTYDVEVRSAEMKDADKDSGVPIGAARGFDYELRVENIASMPGLEVEPNNTVASADRLENGITRIGYISQAGDVDVYAFALQSNREKVQRANPRVVLQADGTPGIEQDEPNEIEAAEDEPEAVHKVSIHLESNSLNLEFELIDDEGGQVATVNRGGPGADEKLSIELPGGLYFLMVKADRGFSCDPYRLTVHQN